MSIEEKILEIIACKQVISLQDLEKEIKLDKTTLRSIIGRLSRDGYVCISNLLSPNIIAITVKGKNSIDNYGDE